MQPRLTKETWSAKQRERFVSTPEHSKIPKMTLDIGEARGLMERPKIKWRNGSASLVGLSEIAFLDVLEEKLFSLAVPSSPSPKDGLNIALSFKNADWHAATAVNDDGVWYLFKNGKKECLGWVKVSYAMRDFLSGKFDVMCEVVKSDDWCHAYFCCKRKGEKRSAQEKRGRKYCQEAVLFLLLARRNGTLSVLPSEIVQLISHLIWQTRHDPLWMLCEV